MSEVQESPCGRGQQHNMADRQGSTTEDAAHGQTVAKHYNELQESGREVRAESRIFHMRNFNNWIKSVLIGETMQQLKQVRGYRAPITVLDMCSGKGGDLLKWKKGGISRLVCADIAQTSVEQSEVRYKDMVNRERYKDRIFQAEFIAADCSKARLKDLYKDREVKFDVSSCQFSFHYSFESLPQVEAMLRNAVESVSLGGYFIGSTPNSQELVRRLRASEDMEFGNEVYRIKFELPSKDDIPLFGARYNFHLEGVVDCPEFLVFFPVLEKMAEKHGMKLVYKKPFAEYFNENVGHRDHRNLLGRMKALEPYPPERGGHLLGLPDKDYEHAAKFVEDLRSKDQAEESHNRPVSIGTLSKAEWEAVTIYCVFMFQKVRDMETGEELATPQTSESPRKRAAPEATDAEPPKIIRTS